MDAPKYDTLKGRRQSETCTVDGCGKPTCWLELCKRHYLEHHARAGKAWAIRDYGPGNARRRAGLYGRAFEAVDRAVLFERDGWVCQLCFESVDPSTPFRDARAATVDHIVPLSLGGDHVFENCQLAHRGCNASKGNRG